MGVMSQGQRFCERLVEAVFGLSPLQRALWGTTGTLQISPSSALLAPLPLATVFSGTLTSRTTQN